MSSTFLARLATTLFLLFTLFSLISCSGSNNVAGTQPTSAQQLTQTPVDFDLTGIATIDSASITISNHGNRIVNNPDISLKGFPALTRSSILSSFTASGPLSDEDFAIASWKFVYQHVYPFCVAGSPVDAYNHSDDPQTLVRGYGFGCCEQISDIMVWLWEGAGYQARVASMSFHTVSEIYYAGAWHMFDAEHRVYYLQLDNKTVASVADLIANPYLVSRTADANGKDPIGYSAQFMADQYAAAGPSLHYITPSYSEEPFTLRPSESLTLSSENLTSSVLYGFIADLARQAPYSVSSARYDLSLDFSNSNWNSLSTSSANVTTVQDGGQTFLTSRTGGIGSAVFPMSSPSPVLALQLTGRFYDSSPGGAVNVYFSLDGNHWSYPYPVNLTANPSQTSIDLSALASGAYSYFIKLEFSGSAGSARAGSVNIVSDVQTNKVMFPALVPGVVNHLTYQDVSANPQSENVSITFSIQQSPAVSNGISVPISAALPSSIKGSNALEIQTAGSYLKTGATFTWPTSASGTWSLDDDFPGIPLDPDPILVNQPISTSPSSVNFITPSSTLWVVSNTNPQVELVGRPTIQPLLVTSAVPQSPGLPSSDGPSSLIDGDPDTLAYPGSNHLDYTISLAGPTHVSAAAISWGVYGTQTGYVQSWTLYGRNGSSNAWQVLTQGGVPSVAVTGVQLNQIVTDLRIVADGANWIGIYELSIAGAAPLSGLVATSNMLEVPIVSATPALNLVDGNDSTMSYISNINTDYSIALPSLSYIDGVRIVWGDFGTTATYIDHWQLYGQKPGNAEWQVLARGENPGTSETVVNVLDTFSSLRIAAESDLNWIGIYEVHVFGAAAPAPSIRQ